MGLCAMIFRFDLPFFKLLDGSLSVAQSSVSLQTDPSRSPTSSLASLALLHPHCSTSDEYNDVGMLQDETRKNVVY